MLDGFSNGAYDWWDLNLGWWAVFVGVMLGMIAVAVAYSLALLRAPEERHTA